MKRQIFSSAAAYGQGGLSRDVGGASAQRRGRLRGDYTVAQRQERFATRQGMIAFHSAARAHFDRRVGHEYINGTTPRARTDGSPCIPVLVS